MMGKQNFQSSLSQDPQEMSYSMRFDNVIHSFIKDPFLDFQESFVTL